MAGVHPCLKNIFLAFTALFSLSGAVCIIYSMAVGKWDIWPAFLYGGITIIIFYLGAWGAYKEKKWALNWFAILLTIGIAVSLLGAGNALGLQSDPTRALFGFSIFELIGIIMALAISCQIKEAGNTRPVATEDSQPTTCVKFSK